MLEKTRTTILFKGERSFSFNDNLFKETSAITFLFIKQTGTLRQYDSIAKILVVAIEPLRNPSNTSTEPSGSTWVVGSLYVKSSSTLSFSFIFVAFYFDFSVVRTGVLMTRTFDLLHLLFLICILINLQSAEFPFPFQPLPPYLPLRRTHHHIPQWTLGQNIRRCFGMVL